MTKITNTAEGPRGVETDAGTVFVDPGETVDVTVKEGCQLYAGLVEGEGSLSSLKKADLIAICDAEGVAYETDDNRADLISKIEAARASS